MRNSLLCLDFAIGRALLLTIGKNWKDALTLLSIIAGMLTILFGYLASAAPSLKFYSLLITGSLAGLGLVRFIESRLGSHIKGSPFAQEALEVRQVAIYILAWSVLSLGIVMQVSWIAYPDGTWIGVVSWIAACGLGALVSFYVKAAVVFRSPDRTDSRRDIRHLAGWFAAFLAVILIVSAALKSKQVSSLGEIVMFAHIASVILLTPARSDEVNFLRIMGIGYFSRFFKALVPVTLVTTINATLAALLLHERTLLLVIVLGSLLVALYRLVQAGLLRLMHPRIAELALAFFCLGVLLLGITFPPIAGAFILLSLVVIWYRARKTTWLMT